MRFRLVTVAILLAVASRGDGRPRDPDPLDSSSGSQEDLATAYGASSRASGSPDSRQEQHRELKDIQSMDQSLRTVATQLLNATAKREDLVRVPNEKIVTIETPMQVVHISTRVEDAEDEIDNEEENETGKMKFGIPVNSKFGHFELSNPGHAMAMTEEEIEREMATASAAAQKHVPTTASMLSTWIQLYPPSTTTEGNNVSDVKIDVQSNQIPSTSTKLPSNIIKQGTGNNIKPIRKTELKATMTTAEKATESPALITKVVKNSSAAATTNYVKVTTLSSTSIENDVDGSETSDKKPQNQRTTVVVPTTTKSTSPSKKPPTKGNTTLKPKVTTPKNSTPKSPKGHPSNRVKPFSTRRPATNKNDSVTSTSKIEKVTFKPPQNRTESTEKPHFVTKIKASVLTEQKPITTASPTTARPVHTILSKSNFTNSDSLVTKLPGPTRVNNILKVHAKKPIDDTTKIEIQPIRVNPPVLTIEKIEDTNSDLKLDTVDQDILENSKIDVKFDFNPNVEVQTSSSTETTTLSSTPTPLTTTRRPRPSNKRKKNKNRRRKPSTSSTTTTLATPSSSSDEDDDVTTSIDAVIDELAGIQESKIEPESKAPPSKKKKPNQQTQVQKPIGTQIYNFLSREVMPSVGVMSLVGLGLGLASYFLYPFGGVIARRNYDVEPNYKYNLDEYGGNYGLSEEEVLSKVYSGMTGGQHRETKYKSAVVAGEKNPNYYRYSAQPEQQPTRYPALPAKNHGNRPMYRPVETTSYDVNYRNTEFKYPEVPTTPNYYERQRQHQQQPTDFVPSVGKLGIGNIRQFVVGNVPKEYSSEVIGKLMDDVPLQGKSDDDVEYELTSRPFDIIAEESPASPLTAPALESSGNPAALDSKADVEQPQVQHQPPVEVYSEMENNPTVVAVEHGPRSLRMLDDAVKVASGLIRRRRSILPDITGSLLPALAIPGFITPRIERSSVIQVIPSKSEIEKERKKEEEEEDLSNEILDIIDEALPGKFDHQKKKHEKPVKATEHPKKGTSKEATSTTAKTVSSPSTTASTTTTTTKKAASSTSTSTTTTTTTTTTEAPTEPDFVDLGETTLDWRENLQTTAKPKPALSGAMDIFGIAKRIAEFKLRIGLTILKHASEGFARYIGHVQKRFNGEE